LRPDGTYGTKREPIEREPAKVILIEGAYSAYPELADLVDLAILVDVPVGERHARLEAREDKDFDRSLHRIRQPSRARFAPRSGGVPLGLAARRRKNETTFEDTHVSIWR
jgi:hypothetical protein